MTKHSITKHSITLKTGKIYLDDNFVSVIMFEKTITVGCTTISLEAARELLNIHARTFITPTPASVVIQREYNLKN